jgi:hypothetical protein
LTGRHLKTEMIGWFSNDPTSDRAKVEWVVEAPQGGTVRVEVRHERAGTVRGEVTL